MSLYGNCPKEAYGCERGAAANDGDTQRRRGAAGGDHVHPGLHLGRQRIGNQRRRCRIHARGVNCGGAEHQRTEYRLGKLPKHSPPHVILFDNALNRSAFPLA